MDKVIGLGSAGVNILTQLMNYPQYTGYFIDTDVTGLKKNGFYKLEEQNSPEDYEANCPSFKSFLRSAGPEVSVILPSSGHISGISLALLEQIKDRKINVILVRGNERQIGAHTSAVDRATTGVLQEYARSGLFNEICIINNKQVEEVLGDVPMIGYHDAINSMVSNTIHMMNVFDHQKPVISDIAPIPDIYKISTLGFWEFDEKNEEKLFFPLDTPRMMRYYIAINQEQLETDGTLNKKINDFLEKTKEREIDISYGVYSTKYDKNFVYCKAYTNIIQEIK